MFARRKVDGVEYGYDLRCLRRAQFWIVRRDKLKEMFVLLGR